MFKLTTISAILLVTTIINVGVTIISWRRKGTAKSGLYFSWGMLGLAFWTLTSALDYAAISIPLKVFFAKLEIIGYTSSLSLFIVFTLYYMGEETWLRKKWVKILLWVYPLSNIIMAWTNEWHGWLWVDFTRSNFGDNIVLFHHGPGYIWLATTGYISIFLIIFNLWHSANRGSEISRRQARLLVIASTIPIIGNVLYLLNIEGVRGIDWSSILFTISGLLFLLALYSTRFLDIVPIARHTMIERMKDIVLVIDNKNRVVDLNRAALDILKIDKYAIGEEAASVLTDWPQIVSLVTASFEQTIPLGLMLNKTAYDIHLTRLQNSSGQFYGKMVVLRNITQRHLVERALQLRSQELQNTVKQLEEEIKFRKQAELELRKLSRAIEHMASSVIITDISGTIEYVNPGFLELTGYSMNEVLGEKPSMLQSEQTPRETYKELWETILKGEEWRGEFINQKKSGELYWEYATISPVRNSMGEITHYVSVKDDITARKKMEEQLEKLATIDPLTNTLNRRELTSTLNQELARSHRYGHMTSVIMLDIDHFKTVNDRYGHIAGDHTLKQTAELVRNNIRRADHLGRYGGDEFIILLPETGLVQARLIAEKLCDLIAKSKIFSEHEDIEITSSMGVANIDNTKNKADAPLPNFEAIVSLADRALYEAKAAGRNCVRG